MKMESASSLRNVTFLIKDRTMAKAKNYDRYNKCPITLYIYDFEKYARYEIAKFWRGGCIY
jgi:hypothetical protein